MKYLYISFLAIALFSCQNQENSSTTQKPHAENTEHHDQVFISKQQFQGEKMALDTLSQQTFKETVVVNGMIDVPPHNKSKITTFMGGYITQTPLLIGDEVKKGQLLVSLKNTEFVTLQQTFLEVAEQLQYLENEYTRQKTLYEEQITSQKSYLKAESTYKSNLAHYNGLKKKLEMLNINPKSVLNGNIVDNINIYSPIAGSVSSIHVSNGAFVAASDVIMEIIDSEHIHLELSVFEKDIMNIKKGQKITFKIPEASNETFLAEVHLVGSTIDETTRRIKVHGHIADESKPFIVGMFSEAEIYTDELVSIGLPNEAIIPVGDHHYILVLNKETETGYQFSKTEVTIGKQTESHTEILNAKPLLGEQIITAGTSMLLNDSEGGHSH